MSVKEFSHYQSLKIIIRVSNFLSQNEVHKKLFLSIFSESNSRNVRHIEMETLIGQEQTGKS